MNLHYLQHDTVVDIVDQGECEGLIFMMNYHYMYILPYCFKRLLVYDIGPEPSLSICWNTLTCDE